MELFNALKRRLKSAQESQDWGAIADYSEQLRARYPKAQIYYILKARGLFKLGKTDAAIDAIEETCEKFPENSAAWINRAEFLSKGAPRDKVLTLHHDLQERFPGNGVAQAYCSKVFSGLKEFGFAIKSAQAAYEWEPSVKSGDTLMRALVANNQHDEIVQLSTRMLTEFPESETGYVSPIASLIHLGRLDEAYQIGSLWVKADVPKTTQDYKTFAELFVKSHDTVLLKPENRISLCDGLFKQPDNLHPFIGFSSLVIELQLLLNINRPVFSEIVSFLDQEIYPKLDVTVWEIARSRVALGLGIADPFDDVVARIVEQSGFAGLCRNFPTIGLYADNVGKLKTYLKGLDAYNLPSGKLRDVLEIAYLLFMRDGERNPAVAQKLSRQAVMPLPPKRDLSKSALRIAVCVSGQLRGYKEAQKTWAALGLDEHDTDFFVHTWKETGRKYPVPSHAYRCFSGRFLTTYQDTLLRHATPQLEILFPSMYNLFRAEGVVTNDDLEHVYNTKDVVIEDDTHVVFARFSNPRKMYYKIQKCWSLVEEADKDYDLIIRIRPDKEIIARETPVDWHAVYDQCVTEPVVLVDGGYILHWGAGLVLGDQFAIGTPDAMRAYCTAYKNTLNPLHRLQKYTANFRAHTNLAFSVYFAGLEVEKFSQIQFGTLLDAARLSPELLLDRIKADIANRAPAKMDQDWVAALTEDIATKDG